MRTALTAAALVLVALSGRAADNSLSELVAGVKPAVVYVEVYGRDRSALAIGSGFFIAPDRVVTNFHVINDAYYVRLSTSQGETMEVAGIVAASETSDLAILTVDSAPASVAVLQPAESLPREGDSVVVIGAPIGLSFTASEGIVAAWREIPGTGTMIQITAPISHGSSGSPVVDLEGRFVGVATGAYDEGQNLNFAIPSSAVAGLKVRRAVSLARWQEMRSAKTEKDRKLLMEALAAYRGGDYATALPLFEEYSKSHDDGSCLAYMAWCRFQQMDMEGALKDFEALYEISPEDFSANVGIGIIYLDSENEERASKAVAFLERAVLLQPEVAFAHYYLGLAYHKTQLPEEAAAEFREALAINPVHREARLALAASYEGFGNYDEAKREYEIVLESNRDDTAVLHALAALHLTCENYKEAVPVFTRILWILPDDLDARAGLGRALSLSGDVSGAIDEYRRVLEADPGRSDARFGLGAAYNKQGLYEEAAAEARRYIADVPQDFDGYCELAKAHFGLGHIAAARDILDFGLERHADDPECYIAAAGLLAEAGTYDHAITLLSGFIVRHGEATAVREKLAIYCSAAEMHEEALNQYEMLLREDGDNVEYRVRFAGIYYILERYDRSMAEARKALAIAPHSADARAILGASYWVTGDYHNAIEQLVSVVRVYPNHRSSLLFLGSSYYHVAKYPECVETMTRLLELESDDADARRTRGKAYYRLERYQDAFDDLEMVQPNFTEDPEAARAFGISCAQLAKGPQAVEALAPVVAADAEDSEARAALGIAMYLSGRADRAVGHLERAVKTRADDAVARLFLANAYIVLDEIDKAVSVCEELVETDGRDVRTLVSLAHCYRSMERRNDAIRLLEKALEVEPENIATLHYLARLRYDSADYDAALPAIEKCLELEPDNVDALATLGDIYREQGRYDLAERAYRRIVAALPGHFDAHLGLALLYDKQDMPTKAVPELEACVDINGDSSLALWMLGRLYGEVGKNADAAVIMERYLLAHQDDTETRYHLAITYVKMERFEQAVAHLGWREGYPDESRYVEAYCYQKLKRFDEAVAAYKRLIEVSPEDVDGLYGLGLSLCELKRYGEAVGYLETCLECKPDYYNAMAVLALARKNLGEEEEAKRLYEELKKADPVRAAEIHNRIF